MAAKLHDIIPGTSPTAVVLTALAALCSCGSAAATGRNDTPQTFAEALRTVRPTDTFLVTGPVDAFLADGPGVAADGPSLQDMAQFVESVEGVEKHTHYPPTVDHHGVSTWTEPGEPLLTTTVRGHNKRGQMAVAMVGSATVSLMIVKALAAIKMFMIYTFFATKVGLLIGAYLLVSKILEMKHTKKVFEPPPLQPPIMPYDDFVSVAADHQQYPDDESLYGNNLFQNQLQSPDEYESPPPPPPEQPNLFQYQDHDQYQVQDPYSDQYQHQNQHLQQPFLPPDKLQGEDEDMVAHYSYVRPVTYKPKIDRSRLNDLIKSVIGSRV